MSIKVKSAKLLYNWSRRLGYTVPGIPEPEIVPSPPLAAGKTDNHEMLSCQKSIAAAVLYANMTDFSNIVQSLEAKEIFRYINTILAKLLPVIEQNGGEADSFSDAGVTALFSQDYRSALVCAISMCQEINVLRDPDFNFSHFAVGICHGPVMLGVVGDGKNYSTLTISEYTGLAKYLQSITGKYYSRILITAGYAELIDDFSKRFSSRVVGYVYLTKLKKSEKLYDVYDGDTLEVRNRKRKTKLMFEKGAGLFAEKKYDEARLHFVEVLKADRQDLAAKEYVYLCEKCAKGEAGFSERTFLELW
ncbi:MAG TPA: adenylate/guanylate cyclase domain-containing protein [Desulfitobacteriaceae bacterium]|jgi:class 3 adenylate cyclase|nr:adenylate/guanylate cyclase domain-containing protein [Desulfitobacteriaceae bacterium]